MPISRHEAFPQPRARSVLRYSAIEAAGVCLACAAMAGGAAAQTMPASAADSPPPAKAPPGKGTRQTVRVQEPPHKPRGLSKLAGKIQNTPQSIDVITQAAMKQQASTSVSDALRYAPGITLNSGEGGAHGDNVNLRGFNSIDAFFLDGVRDPGSYTRDNFDLQSIEVLQGPASVLFGNGPAGGVVNQTSKQANLAARRDATVEGGTNGEARATIDVDEPIGPNAAVRLNAMGETTGVADRDYVQQRRWGAAPSLALGINTPTTFNLDYYHQEENNIPDYGIPFLFGAPAPVNPSLYYGLKNDDRTQTDVNIVTAVLKHDFNDNVSLSNTFRYASYWSNYRVTAPDFASDVAGGVPVPGTPLADILVYRDRPSSEGTQDYLTDHTDLTYQFETGPLTHMLITGVELGRQTTDYVRFNNDVEGIDGIPPTLLIAPNAFEPAPDQQSIDARPDTTSDMLGIYATDQIHITPQISVDLGLRFDRYTTSFGDSVSHTGFRRIDTGWSPKLALVYQPNDRQTYYAAYTTSFDPAVSYLTLAADSKGPAPQTAKTYEIGAKNRWLGGMLGTTVAVFRTDSANVTVSDPDDPTLQQMPGSNQRVQGVEITASGYLTDTFQIDANYTFIDPEITKSMVAAEIGKAIPGAARHTANLWAVYEPNDVWRFGAGVNFVDARYADNLNTAKVPGYVVFNAMAGYQVTDAVHLQLNLQNIADAKYFTGAYYSDPTENHVLPGQGRVLTLNTAFSF
jgi:catecholate siderophore receptor